MNDNEYRDQSEMISRLQSMRDRMARYLTPIVGDGLDGDFDTLLETINHLKRQLAQARDIRRAIASPEKASA